MRQLKLALDGDGCPLDQNARSCLRGLAQRGARLTTDSTGSTVRAERQGKSTAVLNFDFDLIPALHAAGWLTPIDIGVFILAPAGRAIVRALKAGPAPSCGIDDHFSALPQNAADLRVDPQSPLAWARQHRNRQGQPYLSQEAFNAGERLRADFHRSGQMPRTTFDWDAISRSKDEQRGAHARSAPISAAASAADERVRRAIAAVPPEMAGLVYDVCCFELGIEETGRRHGMPLRSGHFMLSIALNALARHYGLLPSPHTEPDRRPSRPRHWGTSDYKPSMKAQLRS